MNCRRTACQSPDFVVCKHKHTGEMYCTTCALKINRACNETVVLFPYKNDEEVMTKTHGKITIVKNMHTGGYQIRNEAGEECYISYYGISEL